MSVFGMCILIKTKNERYMYVLYTYKDVIVISISIIAINKKKKGALERSNLKWLKNSMLNSLLCLSYSEYILYILVEVR